MTVPERAAQIWPILVVAEQKRIVAKVEELMRWCGELETHLASAKNTASNLFDAILSLILRNPEPRTTQ